MAEDDDSGLLYKVVVVGDSGVGKTNIITRFTTDEFTTENKATIGVEFGHAECSFSDGTKANVQIWDTAGQERFRAITRGYYRNAVGALIVYDITRQQSFKNVEKWLQELQENAGSETVIMLVGNKKDLSNQREVSTDEATSFARKKGLLFIEASALDGENVKEAFNKTVNEIYEKTRRPKDSTNTPTTPPTKGELDKTKKIKLEDNATTPPPKPGCSC